MAAEVVGSVTGPEDETVSPLVWDLFDLRHPIEANRSNRTDKGLLCSAFL